MPSSVSRRRFLQELAVTSAAVPLASRALQGQAARKVRHASFGASGMALSDIRSFSSHPAFDLVAVADADLSRTDQVKKLFPNVRVYQDWRELLRKEADNLDSVNVSTPDHMHAPIAMAAMSFGKHVYVQKPLATTVRETRMLAAAAREKRLVSQMGIQISSHPTQLATEADDSRPASSARSPRCTRSATRRGATCRRSRLAPIRFRPRSTGTCGSGVSEKRPYKTDVYHPGNWRKRVGFGTGTLGDMGCHIFSTPIRGVNLYLPTSVTSYGPGAVHGNWPIDAKIKLVFPGNTLTAGNTLDFWWYDGATRPPQNVADAVGGKVPGSGAVIIGTGGAILLPHIGPPTLHPAATFASRTVPTVEARNHYHEFLDAVLKGPGTTLLGRLRLRPAGHRSGAARQRRRALPQRDARLRSRDDAGDEPDCGQQVAAALVPQETPDDAALNHESAAGARGPACALDRVARRHRQCRLNTAAGGRAAGPPHRKGSPVRRSVTFISAALMAAAGLVLSARQPTFTRSPRADVALRLRTAARLGTTYVPGRILVKFRPGLPTQAQTSAVSLALPGTAAALRSGDTYSDFNVLEVPLDADVPALAAALAARPEVEYAEPDALHRPEATPTDPSFPRQWNMRAINLERAWDINDGARDVVVAVIDSGLAMANDVLRFPRFFNGRLQIVDVPFARSTDIVSTNRLVAPYDFTYDDDQPYDMDGHGTHVTGTVGQLANTESGVGVAYNARIMPLKVCLGEWEVLFLLAEDRISTLPPMFEGGVCFASDEARAIRHAADNGAKVINISIGGTDASTAARSALQYAVSRGAFVAVSGGNRFEDGNQPGYPALYARDINGVMAVAAVGQDLNRAPYSNTGDFIEIAAPGGNTRVGGAAGRIWQQTYRASGLNLNQLAPRFDLLDDDAYQGTSMAAPHVAGLAALLYAQGIRNPAHIEAAIRQFATDRGAAGRDNDYGFGVLDARATLRGLGIAK